MSTAQACMICLEPGCASLDNKLLTSSQCGHKVCRRCLQKQQQLATNLPASAAAALAAAASADEWVDRESEESELEQEKLVRQKVIAIFNSTRSNFELTPQYNDFLEKREGIIYGLVFGSDDTTKRQLQEELETYEVENQKQIVECKQKALKEAEQEIRDIVKKEGVFYEMVQDNFGPGFSYASNRSQNGLLHRLQRSYPELFSSESAVATDSTQRQLDVRNEGVIGMGGHPKPLQANLNYGTIPKRQPTDKATLLRACGMSKDLIGQRVLLELWEGLRRGLPLG